MYIQKTDSVSPFKAKITVKTAGMKNFMQYLRNNTDAPEGWYNSKTDLMLMNKIKKAFKNHPSKEEISPDIYYIKGVFFNARGTLSSSRTVLRDTEPARSDSIAPILNIFRRILDPQNKEAFIKLTGEEHSSVYDKWWEQNISPIWENINKSFREKTFFAGNYDKEFNEDFINQNEKFWITLWKNMCD